MNFRLSNSGGSKSSSKQAEDVGPDASQPLFQPRNCLTQSPGFATIKPSERLLPADRGAPEPPTYDDDPPRYAVFDEGVSTYHLQGSVVLRGASVCYHIKLDRTRSGKPFRVCIRRLMASESRRIARSSSSSSSLSKFASTIEYDNDATMYQITRLTTFWGVKSPIEIKGYRASTLSGVIGLQRAGTPMSSRWNFFHNRRDPANDMLKPENEQKMERHGYHPDDEWIRSLLFSASAAKQAGRACWNWTDPNHSQFASEHGDVLNLVGTLDSRTKDLLVTLWIAKIWESGKLDL